MKGNIKSKVEDELSRQLYGQPHVLYPARRHLICGFLKPGPGAFSCFQQIFVYFRVFLCIDRVCFLCFRLCFDVVVFVVHPWKPFFDGLGFVFFMPFLSLFVPEAEPKNAVFHSRFVFVFFYFFDFF